MTLTRPLLLTLALAAGCVHTPDPNDLDVDPEQDPAADGVGVKVDRPVDTVVDTTGDNAPSADDFAWEPAAGTLELDEIVRGSRLAKEDAGGWESRRVARSGGGPTGVPLPATGESARVDAPAAPEEVLSDADVAVGGLLGTKGVAVGSSGLGSRGSGLGGGGSAEGLGGLGTAGRGSGSAGFGTATSAAPEAEPMAGRAVAAPSARRRAPAKYAEARPAPVRQASPLRAGATDDNANFDAYLRYLDGMQARGDINGWADVLDVTDKRTVRVLTPGGAPLPAARVSLLDPSTKRVVWSGHTFGDGRLPVYPNLEVPGTGLPAAGDAPSGGWIVQAEWDGTMASTRWDGANGALDLTVDAEPVSGAVPIDVCFVIDTTGSMGDEIARIKQTLLSVTEQLRQEQAVDLRYGAVLYRDIGDEYVTRRHAFTSDLEAFDAALQQIAANGGGDGPESLNQGMAVAVGGMDWREDTARVAFVIADAPPHMDYQESVTYGRAAAAALHQGIKVHTVAASGLDDRGSLAFRQVSQLTRGEFIFIEYGSTAASAADHGVTGRVASNNLDAILYDRIHKEIVGWGRNTEALSSAR